MEENSDGQFEREHFKTAKLIQVGSFVEFEEGENEKPAFSEPAL